MFANLDNTHMAVLAATHTSQLTTGKKFFSRVHVCSILMLRKESCIMMQGIIGTMHRKYAEIHCVIWNFLLFREFSRSIARKLLLTDINSVILEDLQVRTSRWWGPSTPASPASQHRQTRSLSAVVLNSNIIEI